MEEEIGSLVDTLSLLYSTLKEKSITEAKETQTSATDYEKLSMIHMIPKHVLRKIFLYLDFIADIPAVTESCKYFNSIVMSRRFQVSLYTILSKRSPRTRASTLPPQSQSDFEESKQKPDIEISSKEDPLILLKKANIVKNFLANQILQQEKKIEEMNKEIDKLNDELRVQKQINSKTIAKIALISAQYEAEKNSSLDAQSTIASLSDQHKNELESLRNQISASDKEKLELKRHKKVLSAEVIRLRDEYQSSLTKLGQYNDAVSKMKSYFDAMFSSRISPVLQQIKEQEDFL